LRGVNRTPHDREDLLMFKKTRALSATAVVVCALLAMGATALAATGKKGKADSGIQHVAITHSSGGFNYSAGDGTDKLLGATAVTYKLKILNSGAGTFKVTAKPVVLYTATGTLRGTGSATVTADAKGNATVTNGKLRLTKGTGAQKGHSFIGTFSGTGSVVTGAYTFHYKGTYK
jgi:hypothetical protein